ncbi:hypothetical protein OG625_21085 [Streptomyces sp. NBC_01351]|uniref:hypothetical protein n=1 Tax=Streptomyces sp. NBC_01351 TaxID=2903833 RepID=UPI002E2FCA3A|nr:hypothetical protein [Streptomyces sp. NBC_01351]
MNGNPAYHAIALAAATLLLLPLPVLILAGWTPRQFTSRATARSYAYALLCLYALAALNAIPRMLDASAAVVTACTAAGMAFSGAAVACLARVAWTGRRATTEIGG